MKFIYHYRTGDNVLHEGEVNATDRDSAFTLLRTRGIRPSRLEEAPGFFNKLFGKWKRWMAIFALGLAVVALVFALRVKSRQIAAAGLGEVSERHQIYGDPAIIEEMTANGFSNVFMLAGERFLACYAMPGSESAAAVRLKSPDDLRLCLSNKIRFSEVDPREVNELKSIVNGIKEELREYLSDGEGTPASFVRRLEERQEEERLIYRRVKNELEANPDPVLWEERNRALREMGIRTIPRPKPRP